jgi:hypothetical protein
MYTAEHRKIMIIKYLRENQGSTKSDITRGLKGIIAKTTIGKLVDEMIESQIIETKKEKENARDHKLYLKENNPLVYVTLQLDEFVYAFEKLLYYIIENIKYVRTNKFPDKSNEELQAMDDANFYSLIQCINVLDRISTLYLIYATTEWPKKIVDKEDLRSLFSLAFDKLASLRLHVSNTLKKTFSESNSQMGNLPILREAYATDLLELSVERFNAANLQKESEPLISSLWNIHKDIMWYAFPEPRLYKWNFSYEEGYGKFMELCRQNPKQRKDNLTSEEFEKIHHKSSHKMTSNTTNENNDQFF